MCLPITSVAGVRILFIIRNYQLFVWIFIWFEWMGERINNYLTCCWRFFQNSCGFVILEILETLVVCPGFIVFWESLSADLLTVFSDSLPFTFWCPFASVFLSNCLSCLSVCLCHCMKGWNWFRRLGFSHVKGGRVYWDPVWLIKWFVDWLTDWRIWLTDYFSFQLTHRSIVMMIVGVGVATSAWWCWRSAEYRR